MDIATAPSNPPDGAAPVGRLSAKIAALTPLAIRIAAAGLAYALQIALARWLGVENYGVYALAWAVVSIGGYGATFGFSQIAVRFLAHYDERGESAAARGFLRFSLTLVTGGALTLCGAAALAISFGDLVPTQFLAPLLIGLATIPFFALGDLAEGYARSRGWALLALAPAYIVRQALLLGALALLWSFGAETSASLALGAALAATALTALTQMALVARRMSKTVSVARTEYRIGEWSRAALPVFLADAAQMLRQNVDLLILGMFVAPAGVAIYFAATRLASLLGLIEFAVGAVAAHRFARADAAADVARQAREAAMITFWPTLGAAALLALAAPFVLALFGPEFGAATPLVAVLALASVVRAWIGPADDLLTMQGHGGQNLLGQTLGLATVTLACLALIPPLGAEGAALAVLIGASVSTVTLALASDRWIGVFPAPFGGATFLRR